MHRWLVIPQVGQQVGALRLEHQHTLETSPIRIKPEVALQLAMIGREDHIDVVAPSACGDLVPPGRSAGLVAGQT